MRTGQEWWGAQMGVGWALAMFLPDAEAHHRFVSKLSLVLRPFFPLICSVVTDLLSPSAPGLHCSPAPAGICSSNLLCCSTGLEPLLAICPCSLHSPLIPTRVAPAPGISRATGDRVQGSDGKKIWGEDCS